jgi:hypothetical protein
MTSSILFHTSTYHSSEELPLYPSSILFHGNSVDDRGQSSVNIESSNISQRVTVNYDYEGMEISVGDKVINADEATALLAPYVEQGKIVLDATTLGFSELFFAIKGLVDLKVNDFLIIYVEPSDYSRTTPGADSFALSELNAGYKPIPRSVVDLAGDDVEAGVFFLGFEPERLERAFEEYQMLSTKDVKVVFGIPAFQPGWELNSIVPHLSIIENCTIAYCAANDPSSAYDTLEETRISLGQEKKMFIGPIGTKPCGIATALFACMHPLQTGLLFDHRKKRVKRSSGVNVWHRYSIKIIN